MLIKIRNFKNNIKCIPFKILSNFDLYRGDKVPVNFIVENADWAIKTVGQNIKNKIDIISPGQFNITTKPHKVVSSVVHFGSQYMWLNWGKYMSNKNKFVASFFHGKPEDGEKVKIHIEDFLNSVERLNKVVTSSSLIEERLIKWGVPRGKLVKIPLGVDTKAFNLPINNQKDLIRKTLGIPTHSIVIGSFQKDGSGWKDGLDPKLIKGPDLFVKTLKLLYERGYPIFALLTGPARGYVKKELKKNGIPFFHSYPSDHKKLRSLYHALDIYLITSREEGGPMGLLESIACGVPVVSTNVGMASDVIRDSETGFLSNEINEEDISKKVEYLINLDCFQRKNIQSKAREKILNFDWKRVAQDHWNKIYKPLII